MLSSKWLRVGALAVAFCVALGPVVAAQPTARVLPKLSASASSPVVHVNTQFTLSGTIAPAKKGLFVQRQRFVEGKWQVVKGGSAKTNAKGQWRMKITAPAAPTVLKYRITAPSMKQLKAVWKRIDVIPPADIKLTAPKGQQPAAVATTLFGKFANVGLDARVVVQSLTAGQWVEVPAAVTVGLSAWTARFNLPEVPGTYKYRAVVSGTLGTAASWIAPIEVVAPAAKTYDRLGPGSPAGIWGMDVSRHNHMAGDTNGDGKVDVNDDGKPIDFAKAYANGMRFVYIKGTDGSVNPKTGATTGQNYANKFAISDRAAAQSAGLYTGFYHYLGMVETNNVAALIADARNEAIMAAARVAESGGYNELDLPYALDVEHDDIAGSGVADVTTDQNIFIWIQTWLLEMEARTGRVPIIYSGPSAMASEFVASDFWKNYQIWIAHPTCRFYLGATGQLCTEELINAGALPGFHSSGVYQTPWTVSGFLKWAFWQYRASASYSKANGILNGSALDINVFGGTDDEFTALTSGNWVPFEGDYQATSSPVTMSVAYEPAAANAPLTVLVTVSRESNGAPAVSGSLTVSQSGAAISESSVESVGVGRWLVTLPGREPGFIWQDVTFGFADGFGYYAANSWLWSLPVDGAS